MKRTINWKKCINTFVRDESGVVTIEWLALGAGLVIAAIGVSYVVMSSAKVEGSKLPGTISSTASTKFSNF